MRIRIAALAVVGALVLAGLGLVNGTTGGASAATSQLSTWQECLPDGRLQVRFDWAGNNPSANQQWLDLSLFNNGWEPGTFLGAGPLPAGQHSLTWPGLLEGVPHYVQINQLMPNGTWDPSPTFFILTGICNNGPSSPPSSQPPASDNRVRVLAPIESAEIAIVGTPGGYAVRGTAGLPGGCAMRDGTDVSQTGTKFNVRIYNTMPADDRPCTRIYGYYDYVVALGNVTNGTTYTVDVNGKVLSFTAGQGSSSGPAMPTNLHISGAIPDLDQPVPPGEGELGRITLSWDDNSLNEAGFRIYQECGGNVSVITEVDPDTTSIGPLQTCRPGRIGVASFDAADAESPILWSS